MKSHSLFWRVVFSILRGRCAIPRDFGAIKGETGGIICDFGAIINKRVHMYKIK